jgi:hypothetical protein
VIVLKVAIINPPTVFIPVLVFSPSFKLPENECPQTRESPFYSLLTSWITFFHAMVFQLSVKCDSAHDEFSFSFICFLPFAGSVKKFAIKDQMKVGSVFSCDDVSGVARNQPLYAPL